MNQATEAFRKEVSESTVKPESVHERIERLAKRQEQVSKMAREMNEALTKAQ